MNNFFCAIVITFFCCGCAAVRDPSFVMMNPQQVHSIAQVNTGDENWLGWEEEMVVQTFGAPNRKRRYRVMGKPRECYIYYMIKPGFFDERKVIEIYFEHDIVVGFNVFDQEAPDEKERQEASLGRQMSFGNV